MLEDIVLNELARKKPKAS